MLRSISLALRKIQSHKKEKKVLNIFNTWKDKVERLPQIVHLKKLLIIRLDDIGDYIVFRNFLGVYKLSAKWKDYEITLLGNIAWKGLFESFDKAKVDAAIWIDKSCYLSDEAYRMEIWMLLRSQAFEIVICPSGTRPLLLDDICALATGAVQKIASENRFVYAAWCETSDKLYTDLFALKNTYIHEFFYDKSFTEWCCDLPLQISAPQFSGIKKTESDYIICFIGAASKSRRWKVNRWIELIQLINKNYNYKIFISGGKADVESADEIVSASNAESFAGKTSLTETVNLIANAKLVISNNTMAAHAAVSCKTPVIIIANGDNYYRFTEYKSLNLENIITIYPNAFLKAFKKYGSALIYYEAVSADIATIKAEEVFKAVKQLLS